MTPAELPAPLVPAEVDLRDTPVPADMLVSLAMAAFGISEPEATQLVRDVAPYMPYAISEEAKLQ